jgi:LPXTG-motif cell wall-anchored protein
VLEDTVDYQGFEAREIEEGGRDSFYYNIFPHKGHASTYVMVGLALAVLGTYVFRRFRKG